MCCIGHGSVVYSLKRTVLTWSRAVRAGKSELKYGQTLNLRPICREIKSVQKSPQNVMLRLWFYVASSQLEDWRERSTSDRDTSVTPIRFPPAISSTFCLLSVYLQYLALDEIYRLIGAAFLNNLTCGQRLVL